uniref:Uncharacterized protein n=2 Tax=Magallana gigas TaxID=29159 RepID=A0A8W8LNB6_MAGGI
MFFIYITPIIEGYFMEENRNTTISDQGPCQQRDLSLVFLSIVLKVNDPRAACVFQGREVSAEQDNIEMKFLLLGVLLVLILLLAHVQADACIDFVRTYLEDTIYNIPLPELCAQREAILTFIEEQDICKHPKYVQAISRVVDYLGILEVGCRVVYNVDPLNL